MTYQQYDQRSLELGTQWAAGEITEQQYLHRMMILDEEYHAGIAQR